MIDLLRFAEGPREEIISMLYDLGDELATKLMTSELSQYQIVKMERLIKWAQKTIATAYRDVNDHFDQQLKDLSTAEAAYVVTSFNKLIEAELMTNSMTARELQLLASNFLLQGAPSADWWAKQSYDLQQQFAQQVRMGVLQGESNSAILQRIIGAKTGQRRVITDANGNQRVIELRGSSILEVGRRNASNLIRSSIQAVSNEVLKQTYEDNQDILKGMQWLSTLDPKTCFPAGTKVKTKRGWVAIEDVVVGDRVLTHKGRYRKVEATRSKKFDGRIVTLRAGNNQVSATADHQFLTPRGWLACGSLSCSDYLITSESPPQGAEHRRDFCLGRKVFGVQPHENHSSILNFDSFSSVSLVPERMPVCAINLKCNAEVENKVNGIPSNLNFRLEGDSEESEATSGISFRDSGSFTSAIASKTAKTSHSNEAGASAELPLAGLTTKDYRGASASFGAVFDKGIAAQEPLIAPLAVFVDGSATGGTSCIPRGIRFRDGEGFSTPFADFCDSIGGPVTLPCAENVSRATKKDASAAFALPLSFVGFESNLEFGITPHVAESARLSSGVESEDFIAAKAAFHTSIISKVESQWLTRPIMVYDIQVAEDHSFVAEGMVVHNCIVCGSLDGRAWDFSGASLPTPPGTPGGGTSPVEPIPFPGRPPLHYSCRCVLIPIVRSWSELSGIGGRLGRVLDQVPESTRASMDGQVASTITYEDWLRGHPELQDEVLGSTRAGLFRDGRLTLTGMVDQSGRRLGLAEIYSRLNRG